MNLNLEWRSSISLGKFPYAVPLDGIPLTAGVYIFLRLHGTSASALYVGKALNLRSRIKQQLNNLKLMTGIQAAPNGRRCLIYAEYLQRPRQNPSRAIDICERALIRYYLGGGHDLLNVQGTKLVYHEVDSIRNELKNFIPLSTKIMVST